MAVDSAGNQKIDFVWGNMPMQPDTDRQSSPDFEYGASSPQALGTEPQNKSWTRRGKKASAKLDATLDNHIIATSSYEGFPNFTPGYPYDDTITNKTVPNVVGLTLNAANSALVALGLSQTSTTTTVGATALNDGKVKSQDPAASALVNAGTNVALVAYHYVA